jgi:hypothetical protein
MVIMVVIPLVQNAGWAWLHVHRTYVERGTPYSNTEEGSGRKTSRFLRAQESHCFYLHPRTVYMPFTPAMQLCDDVKNHGLVFPKWLRPQETYAAAKDSCELCAIGRQAFQAFKEAHSDVSAKEKEEWLSWTSLKVSMYYAADIFTTNGISLKMVFRFVMYEC